MWKKGDCHRCGVILTEENSTPSAFKRKSDCRSCNSITVKQRRECYPKRFMCNRAKANAGRRGIKFGITPEDIPNFPEYCPVFPWIKLQFRVGGGLPIPFDTPSLDRINNDLGYIPGNVRIISYRANELKRDATLEEIRALHIDAENNLEK